AFGGIENYREEMREARGLRWIGGLGLDLKLGLRMLAKWPGLTLVGILGMAVAVAVGTFTYGMIDNLVGPTVPIDEGNRVVVIENWDARSSSARAETHLHDQAAWRASIRAVDEFGAYRLVRRNLLVRNARPEPLQIAEMTASAFDIARVLPIMGRYLLREDEAPGAQPVVVISQDVWKERFAGASNVIGQPMRIGTTTHTIVGVMPASFRFPVNNRIWIPLKIDALRYPQGDAPGIKVFGRLADGASIGDAQSQAASVASRLASSRPAGFEQVRTQVMEYGRSFAEEPSLVWALQLIKVAVSLLMVVIGVNVAVLVFARTAGRMGEIAVRTALGASRARIVTQLFAEALVLSSISAVVGLIGAAYALRYLGAAVERLGQDNLPYWFRFDVTPGMALYGFGLALFAAFVVGAIPAIKATGRGVRDNLQALGGGAGIRLGKSWTVLIVGQVAVAVALLPVVVHFAIVKPARERVAGPAFDTSEWATTRVALDRADGATLSATDDRLLAERFTVRTNELIAKLRDEPSVADVITMTSLPGEEEYISIQSDSMNAGVRAATDTVSSTAMYTVQWTRVDPRVFQAFGIPVVRGRSLEARDAIASSNAIVVNQPFVQKLFGGGNAIGRHVRLAAVNEQKLGPWLEIVGVVPNFPTSRGAPTNHAVIYQAMLPTLSQPTVLGVRARGITAASLAGPLREVALGVDPFMRLEDARPLDDSGSIEQTLDRVIYTGIILVTLSVVLLSGAGIYALMSFTIARRRREIGIRAALGAGSRQIVGGVLSRAARQVGAGIALGTLCRNSAFPLA
ncbi:MAG TPA: ABC transporter permease, partial [Gemmatimonas sp.]|nr:ABC transporter permease [Gemmatimonas sp.]